MITTHNKIELAKAALVGGDGRYAGIGASSALKAAIREAETARAAFADYRNEVAVALKDIERVLEMGCPLTSHRFAAFNYSSTTTQARSARFREAMRALDAAHSDFLSDIAAHRAMLARVGFSAP